MSNHPPDPPTKIKLHSAHLTHEPDLPVKKVKSKSRRPRENPDADDNPPPPPPPSIMSTTSDEVEPLYMETSRDLEDTFRDMQSCFDGKESEQNWSQREKSILKLRRVTKGNSPQEFTPAYLAGIKLLLDGILKTVNSLRTTVSTNGCHLVQDIARTAGPGLDSMVEILLQSLVKLCANTKKITAANGDATVTAVVASVTYNVRVTQHIWGACQDKNVQPRSYATGWLKTIITKHRHHKHVLEHGGSLDLIEKCLKFGLADRDPKVRESMRPTYWAFARLWSQRSEVILSALDPKQQKLLIDDPSNPKPHKDLEPSTTATGAKSQPFSRSTNSIPTRPSIRETIAAQKRAKLAGKNLPERPGSAEPSATPLKSSTSSIARPATAMSTIGTLSSAPVRPMRPARRPEMKRPVTADPQSSRRPAKLSPTRTGENAPNSPQFAKKSSQNLTVKGHDTQPAKKDGLVPRPNGIASNGIHDVFTLKDGVSRPIDDSPFGDIPLASKYDLLQEDEPEHGDQHIPVTRAPGSRKETNTPLSVKQSIQDLKIQRHDTPRVKEDGLVHRPNSITSNGIYDVIPRKDDVSRSIEDSPVRDISLASKNDAPQEDEAEEHDQRILMTRASGSKKETNARLKVYEDPSGEGAKVTVASPPATRSTVLEELPVNEPPQPLIMSNYPPLLAEEGESPLYHRKWINVESAARRLSDSDRIENPYLKRRILDGGIAGVRAGTLEVHGFRKLQGLIRSREDIWEEGLKFDELLQPLLENLESPNIDNGDGKAARAQDQIKTQVLMTIRLLQQNQPKYFSRYYSQALCAIILARKHHHPTSHIVSGLEETSESIVAQCDPEPCINAVLDLLETETTTPDDGTLFTGLYVLAGLLHRVCATSPTKPLLSPSSSNSSTSTSSPSSPLKSQSLPFATLLTPTQQTRLGQLAARCLSDNSSDIRRAVIEFSLELHDAVSGGEGAGVFWRLVKGASEDKRSLITYYLARRERG